MATIKHKNNYEFRKWAWRKNSKDDIPTIIINADYIPGTNKIYDSYLFRTNKNNIYRINLERDIADMECYMKLYNKTNEEMFLELYNNTLEHYNNTVREYNNLYPKYDNYIIYLVKDNRYIYSRNWE